MGDKELAFKIEQIQISQRIIINQLSAISRVMAKEFNLAIEEEREECEYINDIEGFDK